MNFYLLFTESLRSPDLEDLLSFDPVLPKELVTHGERKDNFLRFVAADKFKDNIYV